MNTEKRKFGLSTILIAGGVLLVASYLVFSLFFFPEKNGEIICEQLRITFSDNNIGLITENDIEQFLKARNLHPVGKKVKDIRAVEIERALNAKEVVKSAEFFITPSGVSRIRITQRIPKFRVFPNNGNSYYIDTERNIVRTRSNHASYLPIVSGNVSFEMASGELFDFVEFLKRNAFWNAQIEQIYIRADRQIELVPRVGESIILLGTLDDYQSRLEKLRRLYINAFNTIGWNRYQVLDLRFRGQIVGVRN
jgi:cell division protein FtsQ